MAKVEIGAIPYQLTDNRLHVVLITSSSGKRWIFPKGHPEKHLSKREVAMLEAYEEAGVHGTVPPDHRAISSSYKRKSNEISLLLYPLPITQVLEYWPESRQRERVLVDGKTALGMLSDEHLITCLQQLMSILESKQISA